MRCATGTSHHVREEAEAKDQTMPPKESVPVIDDETGKKVSGGVDNEQPAEGSKAKTNNPAYNVGGTGEDGALSTEATVANGSAPAEEKDSEYKPS
ncbi:hypothetical protein EJ03DRAFT_324677 [Teratosphaeria nubilosa]|uniref:Uncharacterized protein n=1 Tax=Teratosphaeria nubilosa TaxID=161662 RepID=A0A6G1LHB3_9PEZI|nr:hypothetical protein EJ03DRAFT_324677 [Teratosphaeria nubilosa]